MEPSDRGRGKKPASAPPAGTFRPSTPSDLQAVLTLFAIAARAACAEPRQLDAITQTLAAVCRGLMSPELEAAQACARMWQLFARVATLPKEALRLEAGRAFCRDLDALGQRLEQPPLAEFKDLPTGVDDPGYAEDAGAADEAPPPPGETLHQAHERAQALVAQTTGKQRVEARGAAAVLADLDAGVRTRLLGDMVGQGLLGRSDVGLLVRFLAKGAAVGKDDQMLIEVLDRLMRHLARALPS